MSTNAHSLAAQIRVLLKKKNAVEQLQQRLRETLLLKIFCPMLKRESITFLWEHLPTLLQQSI